MSSYEDDRTCNNNRDDVYLNRHGARADSDNRYSWKPLPGRTDDDTELSSGGLQASQELAAALSTAEIAHIVSSPYWRCLQTVAPLANQLGLPIKVEPGICEVLTGTPGFWDTDRLAAETDLPIDNTYQPVLTRAQLLQQLGNEYGDGAAAGRSAHVASAIRQALEGPILFCGHGASCLGVARACGRNGYVGYTIISHFVRANNNNGWQVKQFNSVEHLSESLRLQSLDSAW